MTRRLATLLLAAALPLAAQAPALDPWEPLLNFQGEWTGRAQGDPGSGLVHRAYQFVLGHRFLHERNVTAYGPRKPEAAGELHEHWSLFSFDRRRQRLVLRQFHQEGFVNQYVLDPGQSGSGRLVFVSEGFENLDPAWRARETYTWISPDAFTETFELAAPGKPFAVYSSSSFSRAGKR